MGYRSMRARFAFAFATILLVSGCTEYEEQAPLPSSRPRAFLLIDTGDKADASRLFAEVRNMLGENLDFWGTAFGFDPPTGFFFLTPGQCDALPKAAIRAQELMTEIIGKAPTCANWSSEYRRPSSDASTVQAVLPLRVESAKPSFDDDRKLASLSMVLSASSAKELESFTAAHVGKTARISANDKTITEAVIVGPILGRHLDVGGMAHDEAKSIADSLVNDGTALKVEILALDGE